MPKITIYEKDETGAKYTGDEIVVFVPGGCSAASGKSLDKNECILIPEGADISKYLAEGSDDSYDYAKMLVDKGFQVVYCKKSADVTLFESSWLKDKNQYNIKYLTTGVSGSLGTATQTQTTTEETSATKTVYNAMIELCNNRKDCIALIDTLSTASFDTYDKLLTAVQTVNDTEGRAALFADWGYIDETKQVKMPGSYFYLSALGDSVNAGKKWDAIAGVQRGVVSDFVAPVNLNLSKYDLDNNVMNISTTAQSSYNGIVTIRPYGWTIWGDRTLRKNDSTHGLKATSFLSIRVLVCDIAKRVYQSAINNTFESNSDVTWMNYKTYIAQLLDQMVADYKLADYKILKLPSDRAAQIKCKIRLVPIEPVEDFDIYINLENATANIEEQG